MSYRSTGCANRLTRLHNVKVRDCNCLRSKLFDFSVVVLGSMTGASQEWWSQTGSNRRPHACKARALPTELWPRRRTEYRKSKDRRTIRIPSSVFRLPNLVGLGGLEPPTSRLSSARSNQLSYKPLSEDRERKTENGSFLYSVFCFPYSDRKRDEDGGSRICGL